MRLQFIISDGGSAPAIPNTGIAGSIGGGYAVVGFGVAIMVCLIFLLSVITTKKSNRRLRNYIKFIGLKRKTKTIGIIGLLIGIGVWSVGNILQGYFWNSNTFAINRLSVISPEVQTFSVTRDDGSEQSCQHTTVELEIEQKTNLGYSLYAYALDDALTGSNGAEIPSITEEGAELPTNNWGVKVADEYKKVPVLEKGSSSVDKMVLVDEVAGVTEPGAKSEVEFGACVNLDIPEGVYSTEIEFYAVPKGLTINYDANGGSFTNGTTNVVAYGDDCKASSKTGVAWDSETIEGGIPLLISRTTNVPKNMIVDALTTNEMPDLNQITEKYDSDLSSFDVMVFPGATSVGAIIAYAIPDSNDVLGVLEGKYYSLDDVAAAHDASGANIVKIYSDTGEEAQLDQISISGDTITIGFVTNDTIEGLGYSAIIIGFDEDDNPVQGYHAQDMSAFDECTVVGEYATPSRPNYVFQGWAKTADATSALYRSEESAVAGMQNEGGFVELYAVWKPEPTISYDGNGANEGDMQIMHRGFASGDTITLAASNFSRDGYGFAGWNTQEDGYGTSYGPNETIEITDSLLSNADSTGRITLYAEWVPSEGDLQGWRGCNNLWTGQVTALTDIRDDNTYAVAKLADGNCWMIENLRLNNEADFSDRLKSDEFGGRFIGLAEPEEKNFNSSDANSLYYTGDMVTMPRYNNNNTARRTTNPVSGAANLYSYGNYYTWAAAIASTAYFGDGQYNSDEAGPSSTETSAGTSICPYGWELPSNDRFRTLDGALGGDGATQTTLEAANRWRKHPNNFVLSGQLNRSSISKRGQIGTYWSLNSDNGFDLGDSAKAIAFGVAEEIVVPLKIEAKNMAYSVRCLASSSIENTADLFTVTYNGNGADEGVETTQYIVAGQYGLINGDLFRRSGYAFNGWNTESDGSGDSYNAWERYDVDGGAAGGELVLYAQWTSGINIEFNGNGATSGVMQTQTISLGQSEALKPNLFSKEGYEFLNWNTESDGSGQSYNNAQDYTAPQGATTGDTIMLYAQWGPLYTISYDGNGGYREMEVVNDGTLEGRTTTLYAPNYARDDYGFAGWSTEPDAQPGGGSIIYGPNETITINSELVSLADDNRNIKMYAIWVKAAIDENGNRIYLQDFGVDSCKALDPGEVIALTDKRDSNVYAIVGTGSLCWMMENLRLDNSVELSAENTNNPSLPLINSYGGNVTSNHLSSSSDTWCSSMEEQGCGWMVETDENCVNQSQINTNNISGELDSAPNEDYNINYGDETLSWYGYGVLYSWYSATAGNGTYDVMTDTAGDICPAGWRLLNTSDAEGMESLTDVAAYPLNGVYSGLYIGSATSGRGVTGGYWTGTGGSVNSNDEPVARGIAYMLNGNSGNGFSARLYGESTGMAVRCLIRE